MAVQKQINDLVAMLDEFTEQGIGHMNITIENSGEPENITVETYKSNDCLNQNNSNSACRIPTLQDGMDQE